MANEIMSMEGQLVGMPLAGPESFSQQQLDYLKRALGVDETELYSDDTGGVNPTLSETPMNFERIKIWFGTPRTGTAGRNIGMNFIEVLTSTLTGGRQGEPSAGYLPLQGVFYGDNSNQTTPYMSIGQYTGCNTTTWSRSTNGNIIQILSPSSTQQSNDWIRIYKIVGIHRIAGGN